MDAQPDRNSGKKDAVSPAQVTIPDVTVSTATAIIVDSNDPYRVLVGVSEKHPKPVIPGGKLERDDPVSGSSTPGLACVTRETEEEIHTPLINPRYIGRATDPNRDVRTVKPAKLATAVTEPTLAEAGVTGETELIRARYGTPDYLYVGTVDPAAVTETLELKGLRFIDIRTLKVGDLSAGHDIIVLRYREMLDAGAQSLPSDALKDFEFEKARFAAK